MKQEIKNCTLEWDQERGVLYVHSGEGYTAVRICGLKVTDAPISFGQPIDISIREESTVSYPYGKEDSQ